MTTTTGKTDRFANRGPRGGAISPVNGRFYAGGRFIPMAVAEFKPSPAALMGSTRQVAWANRLRREELARLEDEIAARLLFLGSPIRAEVRGNRKALRGFLAARHKLMAERSAARVIEARG
jgi:hypothetical protein